MKKEGMTGQNTGVHPAEDGEALRRRLLAPRQNCVSEYRSFAAWHKLQATEEKGK
jgi:hypothetical protein